MKHDGEPGDGRRPPACPLEGTITISINQAPATIQVATQKSDVIAEYTALIQGLNTVATNVDTIYIDGVAWKRADLVGEFQKRLDAAQATAAARNTLMTCTATEATVAAEVDPLRGGTKIFLKTIYGKKSPTLQKFGFTPDRTPVTTPATRAAGVAKAKATKAARGETGKKTTAATTAPAATTPAPAAAETTAPAAAPATKQQ